MEKCFQCGAQTRLFECGVPVCPKCSTEIDARRQARKGEVPTSGAAATGIAMKKTASGAEAPAWVRPATA